MNAKRAKTKTTAACGGTTGSVTETPPGDFTRRASVLLPGACFRVSGHDVSRYECGIIHDRTLAVVAAICATFLVTMISL